MRKFSVVALEHRPITMNESASVAEACNQMRDCRAGSVLVTAEADRLVPVAMRCAGYWRYVATRPPPVSPRL